MKIWLYGILSILLLFSAAIVSNIEAVQQTLNLTLDAAYVHVFIPVEALIWVRSIVIVLLIVAHAMRYIHQAEGETLVKEQPKSQEQEQPAPQLTITPVHAPQANALCERFLRSVRPECLDHLLILHEKQLQRILNAYVAYFNLGRPHQGIKQQIPEQRRAIPCAQDAGNKVIARPVMGGLHHDYNWTA